MFVHNEKPTTFAPCSEEHRMETYTIYISLKDNKYKLLKKKG